MWKIRIVALLVPLLMACSAWAQALFGPKERKAVGETVATYIETTLGKLAIMQDEAANQLSFSKSFFIDIEGRETLAPNQGARLLLAQKGKKSNCFLSKENSRVSCRWVYDGGPTFTVTAEISREAVEGTDKQQADSLLMALLAHLPHSDRVRPLPTDRDLRHVPYTDLLEQRGRNFTVKNINSNTYYRKEKGRVVPAFSSKYPVESLHNLMLGTLAANDYVLEVTGILYDGPSKPVRLPLKDFLGHWLQDSRYALYCGVDNSHEGKSYEVVLVIEHKELQYIHLLKFSCTPALFNQHKALIQAQLTPNIPQQNLQSLF